MKTTGAQVRPAAAADLPAILALLAETGLVTSGVAEHLPNFLVAADGADVLGVAGLEVYGDAALLRSVAVAAPHRGRGLGRRLVDAALAVAHRRGVRAVALLTTTAAPYFHAWGFREVARRDLDPRLAASAEFGAECCTSAVAMALALREARPGAGGRPQGEHGGVTMNPETVIKEAVRDHYARAAQGSCCGPDDCCAPAVAETAVALDIPSFGCGSPVEAAELQPDEIVLDLGAGRGLDAFRAAERVGEGGRVIGVDMTPEMVWRAREDARRLGFAQVEFRLGEIETLPVGDASVDAVISNCVINLVPDKDRAFAEAFRVLRPGGRLVVADIVRARSRPGGAPADLQGWAACVDGAEEEGVYLDRIRGAGFSEMEVLTRGHGEIYSITVRARRPNVRA